MSSSVWAIIAVLGAALTATFASSGCAERLADCVEVYPDTSPTPGANRLPGYTMTACEEHCKQVQGTVNCYWDSSIAAIAGPTVTVVTGK